MKKILLIFIITGLFYSCSTMSSLSDTAVPNPSSAYIYGDFLIGSTHAIQLKNMTTGKYIYITGNRDFSSSLVEIPPGTYACNMSLYYLDLIKWSIKGDYQTPAAFKKKFTVEAGTVYYMGKFNRTHFNSDADADNEVFVKKFPRFADLDYKKVYNIKINPIHQSKDLISKYAELTSVTSSDDSYASIILESEDHRITYGSDLDFRWLDKKTGKSILGRRTFAIFLGDQLELITSFKILNSLDEMSRDEFTSMSKEECEIVLKPLLIKNKTITYEYLLPEDKRGERIVLTIQ